MKYLHVWMPDRSVWKIPAEFIARQRAEYYVDGDIARGSTKREDRDKAIGEDIAYQLDLEETKGYEILDWANNNMNWEDVAAQAIRLPDVPESPFDYGRSWPNAVKEIVAE